jgi:hypothetical protein
VSGHRSSPVTRHSSPVTRPGLSLLEVLFTIFVLAVGLLGLAALLTGGHSHNSLADQADRSAACGRAAFREIETRDMLRYSNWMLAGMQWVPAAAPVRWEQFVIDPLFIAKNGGQPPAQRDQFPFHNAGPLPALRLPRVSLRWLLFDPSNNLLPAAAMESTADRVFTYRDEGVFNSLQRDARPVQMMDLDSSNNPTTAKVEGNYTWLAMVTPAETENYAPGRLVTGSVPAGLFPEERRAFTVAVVVFHKRDASVTSAPMSERQLPATMLGPHSLLIDTAPVDGYVPKVTVGQWIMLSGVLPPPQGETGVARPLHRWYRATSVGQYAGDQTKVLVNLAGPDWPATRIPTPPDVIVTLVDKVVGVFERTVELDVRSLSSP